MAEARAAAAPGCACGPRRPARLADWWRVAAGAVIAVNAMTLSLAVNTSRTTPRETAALHAALAALAGASLLLLGGPLLVRAAREAARRRVTVEAMFLAGVAGALGSSAVGALTGRGAVYFEIVPVLLAVYSFGRQLGERAQERALAAVEAWAPGLAVCRVVEADGGEREVPAETVRPGDLVRVGPGDAVPVDGVVEAGEALVREAALTGEPFAAVRGPGEAVWAGTHCLDAELTVRVTAPGGRRRLDRIVAAVERARRSPARVELQADRIVRRFLPAVLVVAALTGAGWTVAAGWQRGLYDAMAVLVVACPCALGLATPLAVWAALGRLASRGLLAAGGSVVERLAAVDVVLWDKTGTLTEDAPRLVDVVWREGLPVPAAYLGAAVAEMERRSRHPVGAALAALARGGERVVLHDLRTLPGTGVAARVPIGEAEGELAVGRADRLLAGDPEAVTLAARLEARPGAHRIAIALDGRVAGMAAVDERLHGGFPEALAALAALGVDTAVLTGDTAARAEATGAPRVLAGLGPEDKAREVRRLQAGGRRVAMVGDGVNDAEALAAAEVGVAVGEGTELAGEVADLVWHGGDPTAIPWALEVAREAVRTIRGNLRFALVYNVAGMALAAAGALHPVAAAVLMTVSSLVVTWRAAAVAEGGEWP